MSSMTQYQRKERGVVSIMVTLIMMIVITLIVLGFAEISRNQQRSTLDSQLSTQAYYAAESGINDAWVAIQNFITANQPVLSKDKCIDENGYNFDSTHENLIDNAHSVSYTCVLIDSTPQTLSYTLSSTSTVIPLISNGGAFGKITLDWQLGSGYTLPGVCYNNPGSITLNPVAVGPGQWGCNFPVVRADIVDANGGFARAAWPGNTTTLFMVPVIMGGSSNVNLGWHGAPVAAQCNATDCQVSLIGLGGTQYYIRLTALYRSGSQLTVTANGNKTFRNAQAIIDSTGLAQDVLRRVRVAVDLTDANVHPVPSGAIISEDSVCKRFGVTVGSFYVYDNLAVGGGLNTLCMQQNNNYPEPQP